MIRPVTLLTALLAMSTGAYLFAVKHRAQVLDDQLAAVTEQSRLDGQRIRVLQAQWALEIDPTRLTQLATQFTTLQPMKPAQLVTLAALAQALPRPGTEAPGDNPESANQPDDAAYDTVIADNGLPLPPPVAPPTGLAPAAVAAPAAPMVAASTAAPVVTAAAAAAPVVVAASVAPVAPAALTPVAAQPLAVIHPSAARPQHLASRRVTHQPVRLAETAPPPVDQPYYQSHLPVVAVPAEVVSPPREAPPAADAAAPQAGGSMLGMAQGNLPAPQPLGAN